MRTYIFYHPEMPVTVLSVNDTLLIIVFVSVLPMGKILARVEIDLIKNWWFDICVDRFKHVCFKCITAI